MWFSMFSSFFSISHFLDLQTSCLLLAFGLVGSEPGNAMMRLAVELVLCRLDSNHFDADTRKPTCIFSCYIASNLWYVPWCVPMIFSCWSGGKVSASVKQPVFINLNSWVPKIILLFPTNCGYCIRIYRCIVLACGWPSKLIMHDDLPQWSHIKSFPFMDVPMCPLCQQAWCRFSLFG